MAEVQVERTEILRDSDFGIKGVDHRYLLYALGTGKFPLTPCPIQPTLLKFSYYAPTDIGLNYAILSARYYARQLRIREELPGLANDLDSEHIIDNIVPPGLTPESAATLQRIYETSSGILVVLNSTRVQELSPKIEENPEVAELDGKYLILPGESTITTTIIDRLICIGTDDYERVRHIEEFPVTLHDISRMVLKH
ncbi:hypothetical protein JW766_01480 [Candidatus Dojkabacteria bacterium]|nr:hypothetical protein [Candidatus Dojkabacteria bacterium]